MRAAPDPVAHSYARAMDFGGTEHLDALRRAVESVTPTDALAGERIVIGWYLTPDDSGYTVVVDAGRVTVHDGHPLAGDPDEVQLHTDPATAADLAAGTLRATEAVGLGLLVLTGNVDLLRRRGGALAAVSLAPGAN